MKNALKISLCLFLLIFSWLFIGILFLKNLSFTAYNTRPVKECSRFLEKTYGKEFKRTREPVEYYLDDGYHTWKIQYVEIITGSSRFNRFMRKCFIWNNIDGMNQVQ